MFGKIMELAPVLAQSSSTEQTISVGILLVAILASICGLLLWTWSLIHCIRNRYLSDNNRIIGIILIVLLGLLGSLIYLFLPREGEAQR